MKNKQGKPLDLQAMRVPQTLTNGLNAILGMWPGDESIEEIQTALDDLRREMDEFPVPDKITPKIIPKKIT